MAGRHAIITGGGRGIGAAVASELAALGADVTLVGRHGEALESHCATIATTCSSHAMAQIADISDAASVAAAFAAAAAEGGPVSILVNNAGAAQSAPFLRTDAALWQRMLDVNLTGTFHCCQAALPAMLAAGWGRIVNVASTAGHVGYPYVAAYCAAKHGVIGLTRALALETARKGITVNAVCPGYTETDMTAGTIRNIVEKTGRDEAAARQELAKTNPQGRLVQPAEVAKVVGWLVLPGTDSVTSQSIAVAGGEVMP